MSVSVKPLYRGDPAALSHPSWIVDNVIQVQQIMAGRTRLPAFSLARLTSLPFDKLLLH